MMGGVNGLDCEVCGLKVGTDETLKVVELHPPAAGQVQRPPSPQRPPDATDLMREQLEDMVEQGKQEKQDEQTQFAKFKMFCDNTVANKQRAIADASEQMEVVHPERYRKLRRKTIWRSCGGVAGSGGRDAAGGDGR